MMANNEKQEKSDLDVVAITEDKEKSSKLDSQENEKNKEISSNKLNSEKKANEESLKKKAFQLLLQGKRNILICDFQAAVAVLDESLKLFVSLYDEQADELGDPYFYYGKALFELARNESEVLGDQVQDEEDDCDEEDEDNEENDDNENDKDKDGSIENNSESNAITDEVNNKEASLQETSSKEESTVEEEKPLEDDTGNVNDLQLSWENLELAKLIYQRKAHECKSTAIKLAEVYLTLGENGLESENYRLAIEDMKQALKIQQDVLPEEDRRIAETFYHLGVAHSLERNFDEAISCFNSAIGQLQKKVASLKARKEAGDNKAEEEEKDAFYTTDGEIEDILSVIKDIEEKISDMNDFKNQMKEELLKQVVSGGNDAGNSSSGTSVTPGGSSTSSIPITDISHLVRKKRKNENDIDSDRLPNLNMQTDSTSHVFHKKQTFGETYCGADRTSYKWSQTIGDLDVIVPVTQNIISSADVEVNYTLETIQIKVRDPDEGSWATVIDGVLTGKIKFSETTWNLERGKQINIHIEKLQEKWWNSLFVNEPQINLNEIELTRPISDLTEEEEMTLQKIWSKQLEKGAGPEKSHQSN